MMNLQPSSQQGGYSSVNQMYPQQQQQIAGAIQMRQYPTATTVQNNSTPLGPPPRPVLNGEVTCGNCMADRAHFEAALSDPAFIKRWFNSHLSFMALLCFTSFYISAFVPGGGAWLFLASILSLIGASIPSCCCPSNLGWKTCIFLQSLCITVNLVLFLSACIGAADDKYNDRQKRALYILILCNIMSVMTMSFVIQMSRSSIQDQSVGPDMPGGGGSIHIMQMGGNQPVMVSNSNVYPPGQAPPFVMAHAQFSGINSNNNMGNNMNYMGPMGGYDQAPKGDASWVSASPHIADEQFRSTAPGGGGGGGGGGYNMYGGSASYYPQSLGGGGGGEKGNQANWVDQGPMIVATPVAGGGFFGGGGAAAGGGGGLVRAANEINIQYNTRRNENGTSEF